MTNFINTLSATAALDTIPASASGAKLEQKFARALKANILNALSADLAAALDSNDAIKLVRTADGLALALDTAAGWVTLTLDITLKGLDYDPFYEADDYEAQTALKAEKAAAKAEAKARKIAKDKAVREAAKAAREAAKAQ